MTAQRFAELLMPIGWLVLIGGWILALIALLLIGSETCTTIDAGIAGEIKACTDTQAQSVILLTVVGFGATLGSLFLWGLRYLILAMTEVEQSSGDKR